MTRIKPGFIKEMEKYGAKDASACFNCGNCTAICPLSKEGSAFPRKMIRYAHLGMDNKVAYSKEAWLCYYCGECAKTCPREAKPAAFMAAARRYATAKSDVTGITGLLYKYPVFNLIFMTALALFFAFFMYANRVHARGEEKIIEIFNIPFALVHDIGIIIMAIAALALLAGVIKTALSAADFKLFKGRGFGAVVAAAKEAFNVGLNEMLAFKRFRECDADKKEIPFLLKPWFIHASTAWGFMGLFLATILDFLFKDPELLVPLWYPPRLIGTISGLFLMYGTSVIIWNRFRQNSVPYANSTFSDWWFIFMLWFVGLSGFILEVMVYLPQGSYTQNAADILFLVHVAPAMEVVVLAAFTKLAHVFYRPVALFFNNLKAEFENQVRGPKSEV